MDTLTMLHAFERKIQENPKNIEKYEDCFWAINSLGKENFQLAQDKCKQLRESIRQTVSSGKLDTSGNIKISEIHKKTLLFNAPWDFDCYMQYVEHKREPRAKFWMPRRRILEGKHKVATQINEFMNDPDALFLGICAPPGTGKSTLIKFLLSYIFGKYPESANMYVSYADGMVKMMYDSEKSIITDGTEYAFADIFPEAARPNCSAEYATLSCRKKGDFPTLGLISLGGSVTGRTRANRFLVTDDLVKNAEMARSPDRLAKLNDDYKSTLTTRMIGDSVKQIMLGTIWSYFDPMSVMKRDHENDPRYKFIILPVCDELGHSNFEYDHPDNYTDKKIAHIKETLDSVDFSCLYMQRGIQKEGLAFSSDSLNYYNGILPEGEPDNILFYCDVAFGGGDNFSMPIFYQYGESVYIPDLIYDKGHKEITQPRVIGKIMRHGIKMGRMEANNGGDMYCDEINRQLREKGYSANISHKKAPSNQSKISRIEQHAPTIRRFYFLSESACDKYGKSLYTDDYKRFMNDLTIFSFTGQNKNDDAPDSLAGYCDYRNLRPATVEVFRRPY